MPRPASEHPTDLELQILKILWDRETSLTVREIRDALAQDGRDLAHTSVITTLGTMVEKGQLEIKVGAVKILQPLSRLAPNFAMKKVNSV